MSRAVRACVIAAVGLAGVFSVSGASPALSWSQGVVVVSSLRSDLGRPIAAARMTRRQALKIARKCPYGKFLGRSYSEAYGSVLVTDGRLQGAGALTRRVDVWRFKVRASHQQGTVASGPVSSSMHSIASFVDDKARMYLATEFY